MIIIMNICSHFLKFYMAIGNNDNNYNNSTIYFQDLKFWVYYIQQVLIPLSLAYGQITNQPIFCSLNIDYLKVPGL